MVPCRRMASTSSSCGGSSGHTSCDHTLMHGFIATGYDTIEALDLCNCQWWQVGTSRRGQGGDCLLKAPQPHLLHICRIKCGYAALRFASAASTACRPQMKNPFGGGLGRVSTRLRYIMFILSGMQSLVEVSVFE